MAIMFYDVFPKKLLDTFRLIEVDWPPNPFNYQMTYSHRCDWKVRTEVLDLPRKYLLTIFFYGDF